MLRALLLSLALLQGPPMSERFADDLSSGSFSATYGFVAANIAVTADTTLGGTYVASLTSGTSGLLGLGQVVRPVSGWGTVPLVSSGRTFSIAACIDNSATPWSVEDGPYETLLALGRNPPDAATAPGLAYQYIFSVIAGADSATTGKLDLYTTIGDTNPPSVVASAAGVLTTDTPTFVKVVGVMSTVTGGDENGGGTAAFDGSLKVYVDGALVIDWDNQQVGLKVGNNPTNHDLWYTYANVSDPFHYGLVGVMGRVSNICIRDDASDCGFTCGGGSPGSPEPPVPPTSYPPIPCCDDPAGPHDLGGNTGRNPDPVGELLPWIQACENGGVVDSVADLTDGEVW